MHQYRGGNAGYGARERVCRRSSLPDIPRLPAGTPQNMRRTVTDLWSAIEDLVYYRFDRK